jgi:hypothetical protein
MENREIPILHKPYGLCRKLPRRGWKVFGLSRLSGANQKNRFLCVRCDSVVKVKNFSLCPIIRAPECFRILRHFYFMFGENYKLIPIPFQMSWSHQKRHRPLFPQHPLMLFSYSSKNVWEIV